MRQKLTAAVCIIGTELVRGIIQDGHARLISAEVTTLGFSVVQIVIVPDDNGISRILSDFIGNVDIIFTTGGLGPTTDDITRSVIAHAAGVDLVEDKDAREQLVKRLKNEPGEANLNQIRLPDGFSIIPNPVGTAPGFYGTIIGRKKKNTVIISMPGPLVEMQKMFLNRVLPIVKQLYNITQEQGRTEASIFLIPESHLEEACRVCAVPGVEWGTRIQQLRISLYLKSGSNEDRNRMLEKIRGYLGPELVFPGDGMPYESLILYLKEQGMMIAGAESCTGGLVSKILTDIPGSSYWFWGTAVTYHDSAKERLLQISGKSLEQHGAVSCETALAMAERILHISGSDAAYSISGIAGPEGGTPEKPVGTVWFGFASTDRKSTAVRIQFNAYSRGSVRHRAALSALLLLDNFIRGKEPLDIVDKWQYI